MATAAASVAIAEAAARKKETRRRLFIYGGLAPYALLAVVPIYSIVIHAFKQDADLYRMENIPFWFNLAPTLKNFRILFFQTNFGAWIVNNMVIADWVARIN